MPKGGGTGALVAGALAVLSLSLSACSSSSPTPSAQAAAGSKTITLEAAHSYSPVAPTLGATDDYHCTLVDPHVTSDSIITASQFFPQSVEVHHAILFLVPPDAVPAARAADDGGKGWTCFGETVLPGASLADLGRTPWLAAWAPGHGKDVVPTGTGIPLPKGSLVVMQIHYNMLAGTAPVRSKLMLTTVPGTQALKPLRLDLLPAPPDLPCPAGVTGPLCDRSASLADLGNRTGADQIGFVNFLETICGRDPANPPAGDSTSCTWPLGHGGNIVRLTAHMHLLGRGMQIVLNPGTPQAKTLLDVTNYNFDYQRSYNVSPISVRPGDKIQVSCTYDPTLRQKLAATRKLPARFVTWGDGSSDEMCLAIIAYVA
ncbi:MAG: monooxygenase [Acidimicrobiales bacterium]